MKLDETVDLIPLNEHHTLSFDELIELSGLSQSTLQLLVENGALTPSHLNKATSSSPSINALHFSSHHLVTIRTISRLQRDFELENNSLSLIMLYLERIQMLETQLQYLDKHHDH
jgi:DNA-binding transcriptional MerR regulator